MENSIMSSRKYKTIKLKKETYERLRSHGNMGESFDDLINRILDEWENENNEKEK